MSAYDAFRIYNGLKLHFTSESYNYFKYNGKFRSKLIPNNQFYIFERLDKRYGEKLESFYLANLLEDPKIWVGDLLSEDSEEVYKSYENKIQSLTYSFKNDIITLFEDCDDLNSLLLVNKDFPVLLKRTLQKKVSIETLLIMNSILNFFSMWNKNIKDDIVWNDFRLKCIKYFPFIKYDKPKMKEILKMEVKKYAK